MSIRIQRKYSSYYVPQDLQDALASDNLYLEEDKSAVIMILDGVDLSTLPDTWGAAVLLTRVDRLEKAVKRHEEWCRWSIDHYYLSSYCDM